MLLFLGFRKVPAIAELNCIVRLTLASLMLAAGSLLTVSVSEIGREAIGLLKSKLGVGAV